MNYLPTSALRDLWLLLITCLPGLTGVALRRRYYTKRFRKCGKNLVISTNVSITGLSMIELGDDVRIRENAVIHTGRPNHADRDSRELIEVTSYHEWEKGLISIGSNSSIAFGAIILGYGGIKIGKNCGIGPGAKIYSESFHYKGRKRDTLYKYSVGAPPEEQCNIQGIVKLKDGSGVASNVVVLPGATIGKDSWVGPNSVVRVKGNVSDNTIVKGEPLRVSYKRV